MPTVRPRQVAWLAALLLLVLGALPASAQQTGQVTELTIVSPPPAQFNSSTPFRTNRTLVRIEYAHNGNSGNYFIATDGADVEGTGFGPQPGDNTGDVMVGLLSEGPPNPNPKVINLTLLQTRINVVAQTNVPVAIAYDISAPSLILQSLRVGGTGGTGGQVLGLTAPVAGGTPLLGSTGPKIFTVQGANGVFKTRADALEISATANDNFTPLAQVQATFEVPEAGIPETVQAQAAGQPGSFLLPFNLAGKADGSYSLTVRANDQVNDPVATATLLRGNISVPHVVQIVRDTTAPRITDIEIIRPLNPTNGADACGKPQQTLTTGATTFVGNEAVGIRLTFNEPITVPRVTAQQRNGVEQPLTPLSPPPTRTDKFTFQFQPFAVDNQNGPVTLRVSGRNIATNGATDPGEGTDEAGNGVTLDQAAALVFAPAFIVDTIGPDFRRDFNFRQQTSPFQGQVVNGDQLFFTSAGPQRIPGSFPRILSAQILDPPPDTLSPDNASGVDFTQIIASGAGTTVTTSGRLSITLTGPRGPIPVPPQVPVITGSPPSLIEFRLGEIDPGQDGNPNFARRADNGVLQPVEGNYVMTVNMIDRVCNTRSRSITFTVDNTPIRETELQVRLGGTLIQRKGFCIPAVNGQPPIQFPNIELKSTAGDFSTTSSRFAVLAKFNGNDAPEYPTVLTTVVPNIPAKTVTASVRGIEKVDPLGVNFPTPTTAAAFLPAGEFDPRVGRFDGPYTIRLFPSDAAGNVGVITTDGRQVTALDYDVNLDTLMPVTERTFPRDGSFINAPLRFADATVVDPPAIRRPTLETQGDHGNPTNVAAFRTVPGCGIDVSSTQLAVRLEKAYQPRNVPRDQVIAAPGPTITSGKVKGTLRFIHTPNGFDPTLPSFTVNDNRFKVLLEFVKGTNNEVTTLRTDGSMDGTYSIGSLPVDRSGLRVLPPGQVLGDAPPPRQGTYFGVTNSDTTTISIVGFTFLYDTVAPRLHLDNFPEVIDVAQSIFHRGPLVLAQQAAMQAARLASDAVSTQQKVVSGNVSGGPMFLGKQFRITGFAQDLSAQNPAAGSAGSNINGGSGMSHIEYELKLIDAKFQLVDPTTTTNLLGSPCASAAVNPDGIVQGGCTNPIISLRRGALTTFPNSLDPVPSTTDPIELKPAGPVLNTQFDSVVRPQHRFVIDDVLPPDSQIPKPRASPSGDAYLFTIRAVDRAGNQTEIQRVVQLGKITPPSLTAPLDNACIRSSVVQLTWAPVTGVTTYVATLTPPDNLPAREQIVRQGGTVATFTGLPRDGTYSWSVRSQDAVGNLSEPSATRLFKVDTARPIVTALAAGTGVIPITRTGVVRLGKVLFQVTFSETMKGPPALTFDPAGDSVGAQKTTTQPPIGPANVYTYEGEIPLTARAASWDGIATIKLAGAEDTCGNVLDTQPSQTFEIDTGPDFESRFFFNPVAPQEIVLTLLTSEELKLPPRMTELNNLTQIGNQTFPFKNTGKAFYSSFTLESPDVASDVSLTVALDDLDGNSSKRPLSFTVTPLTQATSAQAVSADRKLTVNVPAGAVTGQIPLYVLPPSNPTANQAASAVHRLFPTAGTAKSAAVLAGQDARPPAEQGLKILSYANELAPGGVVLKKAAQVATSLPGIALPQGATPAQLGLYVWNGAKWIWTGSSHDGQSVTGQTRYLGPLAFALDQAVPAIASVSVADGERLDSSQPQISATVADSGSGVGADGISVLIDDAAVPFSYHEESGEVSFTPEKPLPPGSHTLSLVVKDRAGNASQQAKMSVLAPAPFGLSELISYPNPARQTSRIRLRLTQSGVTQRVAVEIFDIASRRVRRLAQDGPFTSAVVDLRWDLDTDRGRGVANGVYLYQAVVTSTTGQKVKGRGKLAVQR